MRNIETEITDSLLAEHYNGSVSGIGAYHTITSSAVVRGGMVYNPTVGPYANSSTKWLKVSFDGRVNWMSLPFGGRLCFGLRPHLNMIHIDAGISGGVGYECVLAVEGSEA